jgi:hypothetical protein
MKSLLIYYFVQVLSFLLLSCSYYKRERRKKKLKEKTKFKIGCIKALLNTPIKNELPANGCIFHQRCGCYILNLIIQDGLNVLCEEINNIRETMKYIRHSQPRMEKFSLAAAQVVSLTVYFVQLVS